MAWARDVCLKASPGPKDLYVFTDLQRSGLGWTPTEAFPPDVRLHVEDLGKPLVNNVAVTNVAASSTLLRDGQPITFGVTIFNHGPFPLNDVPVMLNLTTAKRSHKLKQTTPLDPGKASQVDFQLPELADGLWQGMVQIDVEDELGFDNQRHVAVLSTPPRRVLVLDGSDSRAGALAETFFLETALRLAPRGETFTETRFAPEVVRLDAGGISSLSGVELVVLADVGSVSAAEAERLAKFVRDGGGLLVFSGEHVTADSCASLQAAGLVPGEIAGIARSTELPFRWQRWDEDHPLLEPFRDPQYGDLRRLAFDAHTIIKPAAAARVLAEFRGGAPALVENTVGAGRVLWFTSSCGRSWSDWPRSRLFVPLVHQMLGDLAGLTGGGLVRPVILEGTTPSGQSPGVIAEQRHWNVVNVSPRESETDRLSADEFASRFEIPLASGGGDSAAHSADATQAGFDMRNDEIWHWVALCLLGLLCGEAFLANRTAA